MEFSDVVREYFIIVFDYGIFWVKFMVYGKMVNGRDFILDVLEYIFLVVELELFEFEIEELVVENDIDIVIIEFEFELEFEGMDE